MKKLLEIFGKKEVMFIIVASILIGFICGIFTGLNYVNRLK
ncbi:hypothetical protein [Xylocopilactobacillus apicola]|nr:hypothetical protein [Xylocopilactobacillus apicola]